MQRVSPTLEGFRAAFRRPSLTFAEISWRWTAGAAASALIIFSILEYLDTLPVTRGDVLLLRTRHPVLVGQALGHIFGGSLPRIVFAGLFAACALTFLWIFAASIGRATTVRGLIDYFEERLQSIRDAQKNAGQENDGTAPKKDSRPLGPLLRLNFLRAAAALAAVLGFVGAMILVQMISNAVASSGAANLTSAGSAPPPDPGAGLAFMLFFPLVAVVFLAWCSLNWVLSLAGMFAVRGGDVSRDAMSAISEAVAFCRERPGPVFAVSTWTGLTHLTIFVVATTVVSMPLGLAQFVPGRVVLVFVVLISLAYFAVADWLYLARLAGYVCIAEMPETLLAPQPLVVTPPSIEPPSSNPQVPPGPPVQSAIDREELILSDVPNSDVPNLDDRNLATET